MATDPPMVLSNSETAALLARNFFGGCAHEDEKGRN
jgi:hypothetical protein